MLFCTVLQQWCACLQLAADVGHSAELTASIAASHADRLAPRTVKQYKNVWVKHVEVSDCLMQCHAACLMASSVVGTQPLQPGMCCCVCSQTLGKEAGMKFDAAEPFSLQAACKLLHHIKQQIENDKLEMVRSQSRSGPTAQLPTSSFACLQGYPMLRQIMSSLTLHFVTHQPPHGGNMTLLSYPDFRAVYSSLKVKIAAARDRFAHAVLCAVGPCPALPP